ncbi:ribonuclease HII [Candidatus Hydrogenosomobacter endosymbioticus]|uniref:Ribonuclease HII n=2 Tax=Candidatus Hydrogenosomobacter endosymbioticus TaxID=2558174 RepID=A0ABM7V915_9PROT|nr:ribonuclease HII [Candidatus Hydrogenosomobacter endosymbioticus]
MANPDFHIERGIGGLVAGIDEVGYGALAGPVVAAAVVFHSYDISESLANSINDSKVLSASNRVRAYGMISSSSSCSYAVGIAEVDEINCINVLQATFLAMKRAYKSLSSDVGHLIIDGNKKSDIFDLPHSTVVCADKKSTSVAAASIIAKVTRDKMMADLGELYPQFNWKKNKGYGTKEHMGAILTHGPTELHRRYYKPFINFSENIIM